MKEQIKQWLTAWRIEYVDCGAMHYDPTDDYTDFVAIAAEKVSEDPAGNRAIVLGATGQGEAMVANRRHGVRAAVYYGGPEEIVALSREHNAANVLSLGVAPGSTVAEGVPMDPELVKRVVKLWLDTPFSEDPRHVRRIAKIDPA
jgi:ribose 5-phosphate isomerase B